jgi:serine protease AprX
MTPQESFSFPRQQRGSDIAGGEKVCPVCSRETPDEFVPLIVLDEDLQKLVRANAPDTREFAAICSRCLHLFERAQNEIERDAAVQKDGSHVLSTPLRLDADDRFSGKGVTIAFLDSGFYPHVDLTTPKNRIIAYRSLLEEDGELESLFQPDVASWHGMMTSVVAAGNGSLSNGFYRGLAPDSDVVLVKLARTGRITEEDIQKGLEWVLENREKYNIRVVNISAGGDFEQSYLDDSLSQTVERCTAAGITIVCAVGNAGHLPNHPVFPPASAPSCIAVGGLDDNNSINRAKRGMYRSSYGPTVDGLQKPEVIAPSIWIPAPILPNTPTAQQAELLQKLDKSEDGELHDIIRANPGNRRRTRRRTRPSGPQHSTDHPSQAPSRECDHAALQVRRRHFVLRSDRLIAGRTDARSESRTHAAKDKTNSHLDCRTAPALRGRSPGLGCDRSEESNRDRASVLN